MAVWPTLYMDGFYVCKSGRVKDCILQLLWFELFDSLLIYLFFPPGLLRLLRVQFSVQSRSTNTPESSLCCSHWWFLWSKCEIRTSLSLSNIRPDHLESCTCKLADVQQLSPTSPGHRLQLFCKCIIWQTVLISSSNGNNMILSDTDMF